MTNFMRVLVVMGFIISVLEGCTPLLTLDVQKELQQVSVALIPERTGQKLRQSLMYYLQSNPAEKKYELKVELFNQDADLGLGTDAKSYLMSHMLDASYQLIRLSDHKIIHKGQLSARNYTDLPPSYYSRTVENSAIQDSNIEQLVHVLLQELAYLFAKKLHLSHLNRRF